jgi:hypothetical protein
MNTFIFGALTGLLVVTASALQETFKPVATVRDLHDAMITPASDAIFEAGNTPPGNDREWTALRNNALILAESGNLLMLEGRAKDNDRWMKMSRALVDAAATAVKAAEDKNADAVVEASDPITESCMNCHEPYRDNGRPMMKNQN